MGSFEKKFQPPTTGDGYCNKLIKEAIKEVIKEFQPPTTGDGYCNMIIEVCADCGDEFQPPTTGDGYCNRFGMI